MPQTLEGVLANIPGLAGYLAQKQYNEQSSMGDVQQAGSLVGLQQRLMASDREQKFRAALAQAKTPEEQVAVAMQFGSPDAVGRTLTGSADRKAALEASAMNKDATLAQADAQAKARLDEVKAAREQRLQELQLRLQDSRLNSQERLGMMREVALIRSEASREKAPAGYRFKPDGSMEAISGGPADTKIQGQLNQDTSMLQSSQADLDRLSLEAQRLLQHPGLAKTTGLMSAAPGIGGVLTIPGTDAANFKAGLDTLKSQTGLNVLQNMRNNSKTGGALGAVSDFENKILQANLGSLNTAQSEAEFKAALEKIIKYTEEAKNRLRNAYNLKHKDRVEASPAMPAEQTGLPDANAIDAEIRRRGLGR